MKKSVVAAAIAIACLSTPAMAQLKLPSLGGKSKSSESAPAPSGDALVLAFSEANRQLLTAQSSLLEALGLKDELAKLQAEQKALGSGALDTAALKKISHISDSASAAIAKSMEAQPKLSAEARKTFARGLVEYLAAAVAARELVAQAQQFTASATGNPLSLVGKAGTAMYVVKEAPGYMKNIGTTTKALFAFAKRNNIEIPANATAQLDGL